MLMSGEYLWEFSQSLISNWDGMHGGEFDAERIEQIVQRICHFVTLTGKSVRVTK